MLCSYLIFKIPFFSWVAAMTAGSGTDGSGRHAPALVAVETVERLDADGFRDAAERIRAEAGELLPGVEYSEGGDAFSLSFPTEVKPKKAKA